MRVIAINGSPRKGWNTDILLNKALEGAKSVGAEVEKIHLYDLNFKGCRSCMACNMKNEKNFGHCAINDDLKEVFHKIEAADGVILGSPIYFGDITAEMRAFLERFLYQYFNFDNGGSLFESHLKTAFIYTMNAPEGAMNDLYEKYARFLGMLFEYVGTVESAETLQVEDYDKYHLGFFNGAQRHDRRENVFPTDCQKAFELGKQIAQ